MQSNNGIAFLRKLNQGDKKSRDFMGDFLCPDFLEVPDMSRGLLLLDAEEKKFFREIYENYKDDMFYTAYVILENVQDTEDVLQEAFVALLSNMDKMEGNSPQRTWNYIVTIVKNKAINLYNKRKKRTDMELPLTEELVANIVDEGVDIKFESIEQREFMKKILKEINDAQRDILLMRYYHDMSSVEIGRLIGKDADSVRHMVMRAKRNMRNAMIEKGFWGGI